jgi:hypothetical protein
MDTIMKVAIVDHVDAPWTLEERPVPAVGPNDVLARRGGGAPHTG